MTETENFQITLSLLDPDLDDEELETETRKLVQEIEDIDQVEKVGLVKVEEAPDGSKSIGGFVLGALQAEITLEGASTFFNFLANRFSHKPIEIEVRGKDGRELKLKAASQKDLLLVMDKAKQFIED
jgi:hypothetical protein